MKKVLMAALLCGAIAAFGESYTWTGSVSSDFSTAGNWSGNKAPTSSENTKLIIPSGNRTITGLSGTWTIGTIELQGGMTELKFGDGGGTLDVKGVISGAGGLTVTGSTKAECQLKLEGANTFSGGFFCNGGRALLYNNFSLGTGPARFKSDGKTGHPLFLYGATKIANDITLGDEVSPADGSIWLASSKGDVTFTGSFTFTNKGDCHNSSGNSNYRIRANGNKITFAGAVSIEGGTVLPAINSGTATNLRFEKKISGAGTITFNGGGSLEIAGSQNELAKISCNKWESGDVTCSILADNAFSGGTIFNVVNNEGKTGTKTLALNGHDVTLGELSTTNGKVANLNPIVTSSAPATLTVRNATADHAYCGSFGGVVSLAYDSPGRTLTITDGASDTAGRLSVLSGSVVVGSGASFANLSEIKVASAAGLTFTAAAGTVGASTVRVDSDGALDLGGRTLNVSMLFVDGKLQAKDTYTSETCTWLLGSGSTINVTADIPTTGWVWTGAAGGNWNVPGNWLKDGEVATVAPGATDSLYIGAATESAPFQISKDTDLSNPFVLGPGRQVFYVAHKTGTLTLRGVISGEGGIDFKSVRNDGYLSISAENTFAGGLCRKGPGQVKLWTKNGLGTGPFTVENPAGVEVSAPLNIIVEGVTIPNDMTFLPEGQNDNKHNGAMLVSRPNVHLSGKIKFTAIRASTLPKGVPGFISTARRRWTDG